MDSIRHEVLVFMQAAERLLSSERVRLPLSEAEIAQVGDCLGRLEQALKDNEIWGARLSPIYMTDNKLAQLLQSLRFKSTVRSTLWTFTPWSWRIKLAASNSRTTPERQVPMLPIRKEVQAFVHASETILLPVLLGQPLNKDERGMIEMCVQTLSQKYPLMDGSTSTHNTSTVLEAERRAVIHQSHQLTVDGRMLIDTTRKDLQTSEASVGQIKERINESQHSL